MKKLGALNEPGLAKNRIAHHCLAVASQEPSLPAANPRVRGGKQVEIEERRNTDDTRLIKPWAPRVGCNFHQRTPRLPVGLGI